MTEGVRRERREKNACALPSLNLKKRETAHNLVSYKEKERLCKRLPYAVRGGTKLHNY